MIGSHIVDTDVEDGFVCVWRDVEKAMFSAVGKENKVNRLYTFLDTKPSDFHTKPLELLIGDVDSQIDALLGKSILSHKDTKGRIISPYTHSTYQKYCIILGIVKPLGGEFSPIRDFIQQEISDMFEDFKSLSDIKDFQAKLVTEFTTRSLIKVFRNKEVHPPKKQPNVNKSDVTENDKKDSENNPKVISYT